MCHLPVFETGSCRKLMDASVPTVDGLITIDPPPSLGNSIPATTILPPIPTPPVTCKAPVVDELESVVFVIETVPDELKPVKVPTDVIWVWAAFTDNVFPLLVRPVPAVMMG